MSVRVAGFWIKQNCHSVYEGIIYLHNNIYEYLAVPSCFIRCYFQSDTDLGKFSEALEKALVKETLRIHGGVKAGGWVVSVQELVGSRLTGKVEEK